MAFPPITDLKDVTIPAMYVDRFAARIALTNLRLAFGENLGDDIRYSAAILMTADAAQQLSLLIKEILETNGLWTEAEAEAEVGTDAEQPQT
jgi:hypothetical protein